jgi:hypothetical protein
MTRKFVLSAGLLVMGSMSSQAALVNRYSFNDPAGDASGAQLTDSVGGAHGVVQGAGALFTGSGLDLPGGSSDSAAYGDLPNNLISVHDAVTVEGWVTVDATSNGWARVFDFGSTEPGGVPEPGVVGGEVTGPGNTNGGGTAGMDYFFLSATVANDYNTQRVELRNVDGGTNIHTYDSTATTTAGVQYHFAATWANDGDGTSTINLWRDGVHQVIDGGVDSTLGDLNDVNNWLGRSTWLNDGNLDGTFDEFRIYNTALTGDQVAASMAAGPDGAAIPEASSALLGLVGLMMGLGFRRR